MVELILGQRFYCDPDLLDWKKCVISSSHVLHPQKSLYKKSHCCYRELSIIMHVVLYDAEEQGLRLLVILIYFGVFYRWEVLVFFYCGITLQSLKKLYFYMYRVITVNIL